MSFTLVRPTNIFLRYCIVGLCVFLILVGLFARLFWLKYVPFSYYHDEMDYVFTGEAIARFGTNISGEWSPWMLKPELTVNVTGELPALFQAITQRLFGLGADYGRYTSALFGLMNAVLVGYIALKVWKDSRVALFSSICMLIIPWSIDISRMAYEAPISLFFQLVLVLALHTLLFTQPKKEHFKFIMRWVLIGSIGAFFAFYTYHATKFIVPSILLASVAYAFFAKKTRWVVFPIVAITLVVCLLWVRTLQLQGQGSFRSRNDELIFSSTFLSPLINNQRLDSLELPGTSLVLNKGTIFVSEAIKRYASVFDVTRLGINGYEGGFQFSLVVNGFFFISVMAMMAFGIFRGLKHSDEGMKYLLLVMAVSPVATVINSGYQSIFRSALAYTMLLMFAGFGFAKLSYEKSTQSRVIFVGLLLCACVELSVFTHQYFNRYGVISADNHYFSKKLLAGYLSRLPKDKSIVVIGDQSYVNARAFVAYDHLMPELTLEERKGLGTPNLDTYVLQNVRFTQTCEGINAGSDVIYVIDGSRAKGCRYANEVAAQATRSGQKIPDGVELPAISSQVGSGTYFNMINDPICARMALPHFVRARTIASFDPVSMSDEDYCKIWVKSEPIGL